MLGVVLFSNLPHHFRIASICGSSNSTKITWPQHPTPSIIWNCFASAILNKNLHRWKLYCICIWSPSKSPVPLEIVLHLHPAPQSLEIALHLHGWVSARETATLPQLYVSGQLGFAHIERHKFLIRLRTKRNFPSALTSYISKLRLGCPRNRFCAFFRLWLF